MFPHIYHNKIHFVTKKEKKLYIPRSHRKAASDNYNKLPIMERAAGPLVRAGPPPPSLNQTFPLILVSSKSGFLPLLDFHSKSNPFTCVPFPT